MTVDFCFTRGDGAEE